MEAHHYYSNMCVSAHRIWPDGHGVQLLVRHFLCARTSCPYMLRHSVLCVCVRRIIFIPFGTNAWVSFAHATANIILSGSQISARDTLAHTYVCAGAPSHTHTHNTMLSSNTTFLQNIPNHRSPTPPPHTTHQLHTCTAQLRIAATRHTHTHKPQHYKTNTSIDHRPNMSLPKTHTHVSPSHWRAH